MVCLSTLFLNSRADNLYLLRRILHVVPRQARIADTLEGGVSLRAQHSARERRDREWSIWTGSHCDWRQKIVAHDAALRGGGHHRRRQLPRADRDAHDARRADARLGETRCGALLPNVDAIEDQDDEAAIRDARKGERYKRIVEMLTAPVT